MAPLFPEKRYTDDALELELFNIGYHFHFLPEQVMLWPSRLRRKWWKMFTEQREWEKKQAEKAAQRQ